MFAVNSNPNHYRQVIVYLKLKAKHRKLTLLTLDEKAALLVCKSKQVISQRLLNIQKIRRSTTALAVLL